ncbi:hypothetical protein E2562_035586 [Oryza meyeriana var. granulata]|uniref:Uncharacterized protein n=1 Tax=Oryza meyeriana var. granulata TaxID=110450 RepID=A0A6G1CAT1_9ORYZ|nr:hypothetical protein E2562_035586 [Oryza meyeriana var. granulata]
MGDEVVVPTVGVTVRMGNGARDDKRLGVDLARWIESGKGKRKAGGVLIELGREIMAGLRGIVSEREREMMAAKRGASSTESWESGGGGHGKVG